MPKHTNRRTRRSCGRVAHAAALLAIFSSVLIAPLQSFAQLPLPLPLPGSLVVTLTSPRSGSTVGGTIPVTASVSIVGSLIVRGVQFKLDGGNLGGEDTSAPYSVSWDPSTTSEGPHPLTAVARDDAGNLTTSEPVTVTVSHAPPPPPPAAFAPGDVFVSLETGTVQWRKPDGTMNAELVGRAPGPGEGIRFDAAGNLYVTHWCADDGCTDGSAVEKFNTIGVSEGTVDSEFYCGPHALAFDAAGNMYVGQSNCDGAILKLSPGQPTTVYAVAIENGGSSWIDLASGGWPGPYTSLGPGVKELDTCINTQPADFNPAPLPGGVS